MINQHVKLEREKIKSWHFKITAMNCMAEKQGAAVKKGKGIRSLFGILKGTSQSAQELKSKMRKSWKHA